MPKKPTTPFGYIAFGKDGSVKRRIEQLSNDKTEQERSVGQAFIEMAKELCGQNASFQKLAENDNDFRILVDGKPLATVECIEIVYRDFLAAPGRETKRSVLLDGKLQAIDTEKRDAVLETKIEKKLAKHYDKAKGEQLWLLIWSVTGDFGFYEAWQNGTLIVPTCVQRARAFLQKNGADPFDRIFSFSMVTKPTVIWPVC